jgi:hypothetical protein
MSVGELATLLAAAASFLTAIAGLVVAVRTALRVEATHALVNGQSEAIGQLREDRGRARGVAEGMGIVGDFPTPPNDP